MRDFKNMKRQRGRNRGPAQSGGSKPNPHNINRSVESNGPEGIKVRGNAQSVYEKYQQLARDSFSAGDRVLAENYLQHAEHYFRVLRALQPTRPPSDIIGRDVFTNGYDIDFEDEALDEIPVAAEPEPEPMMDGDQRDRPGEFRQRDDARRDERPRDDFRRDDRGDRQQGDRPAENRQGEGRRDRYDRDRNRPRDGDRPQGDRPQGERYDRDRPQGGDRPQGERYDRDRPRDGERPQGERYDRERPRDGERPQGERFDRDRPRDGERPQGERYDRDRPRDGERRDRFDRDREPRPAAEVIQPAMAAEVVAPADPDEVAATTATVTYANTPAATDGDDAATLRSENGDSSPAPAFLQSSAAAPVTDVEDAEPRKPRPRRRRTRAVEGEPAGEAEATPAAEDA